MLTAEKTCECGCGGIVKSGKPFRRGHHNRTEAHRERTSGLRFHGARVQTPNGYIKVGIRRLGQRFEHIVIAEQALGRALPAGAVVHHVNEDPTDNSNRNLVICPNQAYHRLLHRRTDALAACGHADWRRCQWCKKYSPSDNLYIGNGACIHRECRRVKERIEHAKGTSP